MSNWTDQGIDAALNIFNYAQNLVEPSLKLGVTGLSRSGKTVFITSLIYHLLERKHLPFFEPLRSGRIIDAYLEPHPDDLLPRFDYEGNLKTLTNGSPENPTLKWPEGTRYISQLRLTIIYQSDHFISRHLGESKLHIDVIDYPGEWLLDLPLLEKDYQTWSREAFKFAKQPHAKAFAKKWLKKNEKINPRSDQGEATAKELAESFTDFLNQTRENEPDLPTFPPGRFLMPGDLKNSPALTFAPLKIENEDIEENSLASLMERRFEAYKTLIIRPFYRQFFTRLDRQIVLVDVLSNLNAGKAHLDHLQNSLTNILKSFSPGAPHWLTSIWNKKIDRLVFAATKADHLHHHNHDQLQNLLSQITHTAIKKAELKGAEVKVQALASLRTTREVTIEENGETYDALAGTPLTGTEFQGQVFDGKTETILFTGDLKTEIKNDLKSDLVSDLAASITDQTIENDKNSSIEIINFAPPQVDEHSQNKMPHIRLDRALNMLIGDKLK
ncbi:YcjX family protein [Hyphomicrobiales bacterium 4NK60-0047b]